MTNPPATSGQEREGRAREVLAKTLEHNDQSTSAASVRRKELSGWMVPTHVAIDAMLAFATTEAAEAQAEITRLRGLLIDPGDPAWEDARAVLVAELQKAGLTAQADGVADADGSYVPSWIALNLIAHAATRPDPGDTALEQARGQVARGRPFSEWHEDHGNVLWWKLPIHESPYVGSPLDLGRSMKVVVQVGFEEHDLPITMTGGWPFSEHDEGDLWWTPLPAPTFARSSLTTTTDSTGGER